MGWVLYSDQTYTLLGSPASGDNQILISGLTGDQVVIEAVNPSAEPTWKLAARSFLVWPLPTFPGEAITLRTYAAKIRLAEKTLIAAPLQLNDPYTIELSVPHWHKTLIVKVWQLDLIGGEVLTL